MSEKAIADLIKAKEALDHGYMDSLSAINATLVELGASVLAGVIGSAEKPKRKYTRKAAIVEGAAGSAEKATVERTQKATKGEMAKLETQILAACESCEMSMGALIAATEAPEARVRVLVGHLAKAGAITRLGSRKGATYKLAIAGDIAAE